MIDATKMLVFGMAVSIGCFSAWSAGWLPDRNRCVILRLQVIFRLFRDNLTNKSPMTLALVVGLLFLC